MHPYRTVRANAPKYACTELGEVARRRKAIPAVSESLAMEGLT